MLAVYDGRYERIDGSLVEGPSLAGLVAATDPDLARATQNALDHTLAGSTTLKNTADSGKMAYDQMLAEGNAQGNAMIEAVIDALLEQTRQIEQVVSALDLGSLAFEGSDSLDAPEAVFQ
jgi:putative iron-regulated protein